MKKEKELPVEMKSVDMETINTLRIQFKSVLLKPRGKEGFKLLCGYKFSPKENLNYEAKKRVEQLIREGKHLGDFSDFVAGKINNPIALTNMIEVLGWSAGVFTKMTKPELTEQLYLSYLKSFKDGWEQGSKS